MKTWMDTVKGSYVTFNQLVYWDSIYGVVEKCGYESPESFWIINPLIGGSTIASDFGVVSIEELVDFLVPSYKEAILFTESKLNEDRDWYELSFSTQANGKIYHDLKNFIETIGNVRDILELSKMRYDLLGCDFWFTRNGHGTGFWDREDVWGEDYAEKLTEFAKWSGQSNAYIGDDDLIYMSR